MARQINSRRGAVNDGNSILLCFYGAIRNPFVYIGILLLTGLSFHFLSDDPFDGVVGVATPKIERSVDGASGLRVIDPAVETAPPVAAAVPDIEIESDGSPETDATTDEDENPADEENKEENEEETSGESESQNDNQSIEQSTDLFSLNQTYLNHLRSLDPLPKKVHILFPDKFYYKTNADMPFVQHSILALINLNPDWNVTVYDNNDVDDIIRYAATIGLITKEEADILVGTATNGTEAAHIVERSDIARLILMYTQGGFYLDADRLISIPFSKVLGDNTKLCLPTFNDVNFCQDLQCTSPKNTLFLKMIRDSSKFRMTRGPNGGPLERRRGWSKGGALFDMGPVLYSTTILDTVFEGVNYNNIDQKGGYKKARESLVHYSDGLILTKKDDFRNGVLIDSSIEHYERSALYSKYGMKPWAPAVNAVWDDKR